ncbi:hypothetical protein C5167_028225 [Papaver somniferum]|nr:hypothetical protein C5167_028225 [Papaver somniferum]
MVTGYRKEDKQMNRNGMMKTLKFPIQDECGYFHKNNSNGRIK